MPTELVSPEASLIGLQLASFSLESLVLLPLLVRTEDLLDLESTFIT